MAYTPTRLYGPAQPGTTAATVYTVSNANGVLVKNIHIANTTASPATFRLSIGTMGVATALYYDVSVPANDAFDVDANIVVNNTEVIQARQGTSGALTLTLTGVVI